MWDRQHQADEAEALAEEELRRAREREEGEMGQACDRDAEERERAWDQVAGE